LNWGSTQFKLLGLYFDVNLDAMISLNFDEKLENIKNCIQYWKKRELTPLGRITVIIIKSLLLPMLTQLFISLPNPNSHWINNINKNVF
jgi:hypothetical protein